ncbi:hypothetical protein DL764_003612 [Monosporascus ibericus]|uniref:Serine carboxypeptidase S28 n=1 Tax=Monosporascus ibericus TaxID=155417 RepID=A0A4V1XBC0_9PEZI|nr:hypothetical protein DL764_003612 [Monosporascus ibericus]
MKAFRAAGLVPLLALTAQANTLLRARGYPRGSRNGFRLKHIEADDGFLEKIGSSTFEQLLDHSDPSRGTFPQRYWWDAEFFEEGGPIILFNPGESDAGESLEYLTNMSLPGYYAQQLKGAVIMIEHRYFGESVPYRTLTTETLQDLNLPNAIHDMTYFAKNVDCEFCEGGTCNSDENPWVLVGGSYSGALAAWTSELDPGTFAAYHASSAVVQAIHDFWQYFTPIEAALPRKCSRNLRTAIHYIDSVFQGGNEEQIAQLKTFFGLGSLRDADFADILANPLSEFQSDARITMAFCDYLGASNTKVKSQNGDGVDLKSVLQAYASYVKMTAGCGPDGSICSTYDPAIVWDDTTVNLDRPWLWMVCNEPFGWHQVGPDVSDGTNIVSTAMQETQYSRRCPLMFPETNGFVVGSVRGWNETHLNEWTGGWDSEFEKVIFVDGQYDPWRSASVSSDYRPEGGAYNTTEAPAFIVEGGIHCPEMIIDANSWAVVQSCVEIMAGWIQEWSPPKKV